MTDPAGSISYEDFAQWLRNALDNLYDTRAIQRNPLIDCFGERQMTRLQKAQNLRKVMLHCIQSLNEAHLPSTSPDWQAYRILEMRYLDSLPVDEAAQELSISKSQFFRDQARAISLLTDIVWDRYQSQSHSEPETGEVSPADDIANAEVERLSAQSGREVVDLGQLLEELSETVQLLGQPGNLSVTVRSEGIVLLLSSNRAMLRQAVLILGNWAAARLAQGELRVETFRQDSIMGLQMQARGRAAGGLPQDDRSWEIARELFHRLGGRFSAAGEPGDWQARVEWGVSEPSVLVVDDDADIAELFRRYLVGYPWQVLSAKNGIEARQQMERNLPAVILLDVMMPQEDGWEFLAALKASALTHEIPVIVCSVLPSPTLALNLGAAAYLPKPVSQQALIQALTRWSPPSPLEATGA